MKRLRWLPNAITITRLAALPLLGYFVAVDDGPTSLRAALCFTIVGATDFLDGILARSLKAETRFGRIADPLADRLLMAVGLAGLLALDRLAWPAPAIILARDAVAVAAFVLLARRGVEMRVDFAGKVSSTIAMVAVGLALLIDESWVDAVFWGAAAISVATFVNYARVATRNHGLSAST